MALFAHMAERPSPRNISPSTSPPAEEPLLSVIIPTRHEASTIGHFATRLVNALDSIPFELVIVDDSDADNTVEVLLQVQDRLGPERMVVLHRPRGSVAERTLGTAVVTGIGAARGTYVCVIDADGQHPPEVIPALLSKALQTGADYIGASRYMPGGSPEGLDGVTRKAVSSWLALLTRLAFIGTPIRSVTDPLSGFFLFRRSLVRSVALKPVGWKISLEVLVRSRATRLAEVPYTFARRAEGDSKASFSQGLLVLQHILTLLWSLSGIQRIFRFGLVGLSGTAVNTGTLLALAGFGFDALAWPIWVATELAILWNYALNKRFTWADRQVGSWWLYNLAALGSSLVAIACTTLLANFGHIGLPLCSVAGIAVGMGLNYVVLDRVVFASLAWLGLRTRRSDSRILRFPERQHRAPEAA